MKILYLKTVPFDTKSAGGSITHTIGMANGIFDAGADIKVIGEEHIDLIHAKQEKIVLEPFVRIPYFGPYLYAKRMKKKIESWASQNSELFDVVYGRYSMFNDSLIYLKKVKKCKLVLEFNSFQVDSYNDMFIDTARQTHNKVIVFTLQLLAPFIRAIIAKYENCLLENADHIVVVSEVLKEEIIRRKQIPSEKILVLPNGVDPEQFRFDVSSGNIVRNKYKIPHGHVVIGFAGTFGNWHGIPELTKAFKSIAQSEYGVSFFIIGKGALQPQMQRELSPYHQVHFTGLVSYSDMPSYFSACDILVISNSWNPKDGGCFFGSPTKLFEYMSMGRAIVASDLGQIKEILNDGETALIYRAGDDFSLKESIVKLIHDPELRRKIGDNARISAVKKHTWVENGRRVIKMCRM